MILYHGSTMIVEKPRILSSVRLLDFGVGFYTTRSFEQAQRWAKIKMRRESKSMGYVSLYKFDEATARVSLDIKEYFSADADWLRFVADNRRGYSSGDFADIHIGPVADDNVYASIRLFEANVLNEEETIRRLKTETLHDQIAFHTQRALNFCTYIEARETGEEA